MKADSASLFPIQSFYNCNKLVVDFLIAPQGGTTVERAVYKERWISVASIEHGLKVALEEKDHAFLWTMHTIHPHLEESCNFVHAKEVVYSGLLSIVVKKNHPLKNLFDYM